MVLFIFNVVEHETKLDKSSKSPNPFRMFLIMIIIALLLHLLDKN